MRSSSTLRARLCAGEAHTPRKATARHLLVATTLLACCVGMAVPQAASAQYREREREDGYSARSGPAQTPPQPQPQAPAPAPQQQRTPPPARSAPPVAGGSYTAGTGRPAYTSQNPTPNYGPQPRDAGSWRGQPGAPPVTGAAPTQRPEPRPEGRRGDEASRDDDRRGWDNRRRPDDRRQDDRRPDDRRGWDERNREGRNRENRNWENRNWEGRGHEGRDDARHEWRYRGEARPSYRIAPYRYPNGWAYRSWRIGERMPFLFLSSYYFIDYFAYNLPPPPYGYRWVRYGPDALLVNMYTGEVEDVVYGIFYW